MDGKGAWRDNARMERAWRSLKSESVFHQTFETAREALNKIRKGINSCIYNRPYQSLGYRYLAKVYKADLTRVKHSA